MKTMLICHEEAALDSKGLSAWLASFSELTGMVVLRENKGQIWRRIKREYQRSGPARFLDVLGFRLYYKFFLEKADEAWERQQLGKILEKYPTAGSGTKILYTHTPNSPEAEKFVREAAPDIMIARCKFILKERVFGVPTKGTFVMHPGICPEYRNAHGCFWALSRRDLDKVGMTLLKIDAGVDTGPVYGYFSYPFDEVKESHYVIQSRTVLENLDRLREKLTEIYEGRAQTLDTRGRTSGVWGQPWLTQYCKWKLAARRNHR